MLHIIWAILKIPFILLAVLLILLLILILILLFVPVRYQVNAELSGVLSAQASIHWLCRAVSAKVRYLGKKAQFSVKIFGYTVIGEKKRKRRRRKALADDAAGTDTIYGDHEENDIVCADGDTDIDVMFEANDTESDVPTGGDVEIDVISSESDAIPADGASEKDSGAEPQEQSGDEEAQESHSGNVIPEESSEQRQRRDRRSPLRKLCRRIKALFARIRDSFLGFLDKIRTIRESAAALKAKFEYYRRLWYHDDTQHTWRRLKKEARYLMRHWLPRKAEGRICFGFDDPALTGQALGLFCVLQAFSNNRLQAEANFEERVFEGTLYLRGRIRAIHFLKTALSLLLSREVRRTVQRIRKLSEGGI